MSELLELLPGARVKINLLDLHDYLVAHHLRIVEGRLINGEWLVVFADDPPVTQAAGLPDPESHL